MRAATRRVVITGVGMVTPVGVDAPQTWEALVAGQSGIRTIERFDPTDFSVKIAGEVPADFDATRWVSRKDARKMDPFIHFAINAAMEAVEDAGLSVPVPDPERTGVIIGVGLGGLQALEDAQRVLDTKGPRRVGPFVIPRLIANLAPGHVSILTGARGINKSSVSACASGAHSIGDAARAIAWGDADVMIAGGSEAAVTRLGVAGFAAMRALSTRNDDPEGACRPFEGRRDGFVCAEGAGAVVLETLEAAKARGARIYAEVVGYGQSSDAHHMTLPEPSGRGARLAMEGALKDAGLTPDAVQYINAHGTSTPSGDAVESAAIRATFGPHADDVWVSSTKSMTGHMLGAAGAVEAVVCALVVANGVVPPTINYAEPDPACDLDYVPNVAREGTIDVAMSNSFGFGGTNACLVFRKVES